MHFCTKQQQNNNRHFIEDKGYTMTTLECFTKRLRRRSVNLSTRRVIEIENTKLSPTIPIEHFGICARTVAHKNKRLPNAIYKYICAARLLSRRVWFPSKNSDAEIRFICAAI